MSSSHADGNTKNYMPFDESFIHVSLDFLSNLWYCWCYQRTGGNKMILQALKNMYPKASEKVLKAVMKDLEKCRGKNMSTEELADWIGKLVTAIPLKKH